MVRWWPAALVGGAALPVLDGTPDAGGAVRLASIALLGLAAAGAGRAFAADRAPLAAVAGAGAVLLALLQVRHLV